MKHTMLLVVLAFVLLFTACSDTTRNEHKEMPVENTPMEMSVTESVEGSFQSALQDYYDGLGLLGGKDQVAFYLVVSDAIYVEYASNAVKVFGWNRLADYTYDEKEKAISPNGGGLEPCAVLFDYDGTTIGQAREIYRLAEGEYKESLKKLCVGIDGNSLETVYHMFLSQETDLDKLLEEKFRSYMNDHYGDYVVEGSGAQEIYRIGG